MDQLFVNPNEIVGIDMELERKKILTPEYSGLGPPDLVVILKDHNGTLTKYYHQVYGIPYKNQYGFIDYFQKLVRLNFQKNKINNISYGYVITWDSISRQDIYIPSYPIKFSKSPNWQNLHISSVLRFYRHDSSLLYSIYGGLPFSSPASITIPNFEIKLEDLEYAAELFSMFSQTMEQQLAISRALLCNCSTPQIMKFLYAYANSLPTVLVHITKILPQYTAIESGLYYLIENHLDTFSDDLESVFAIFMHYLSKGDIAKCRRYIPLLEQTKFHHPQSSICLARFCLAMKDTESAFYLLNIAGMSKGWVLPGLSPQFDPTNLVIENNFPPSHTKLEQMIVSYPVTGRTQAYFDAINEIINLLGQDNFTKRFMKFKAQQQNAAYDNQCPEYPFYYSDSCKSTEEFYLFDPGIEAAPMVTKELKNIPLSTRFDEMVDMVIEGKNRLRKLNMQLHERKKFKSTDLLLAVRFKDGIVASVVFEYLKKNQKLTGAGYLLMLRAMVHGFVDMDIETEPNILTADQASVIPFAKGFVRKLIDLERVYL